MSLVPFHAVRRALQSARSGGLQQVRNSSAAYKPAPTWKPPHLDDLPVPQGSWNAQFEAKQKNYNMQLAAGIILFTSTVTYILTSDRFFFNAFPPPLPEDK